MSGIRLVHVSGITPMLSASAAEATGALLELAEERGAFVSFDPNVRRKLGSPQEWRVVLAPLMGRAAFVFAGEEELELVTGRSGRGAVDELLSAGVRSVLVKNRDKSCTVTTQTEHWHQPTLATAVVDPVGAGDAIVSGYLSAWLRGDAAKDALLSGVVSASLAVGSVTDVDGLPDRVDHERARQAAAGAGSGVYR